METYRLRQDLVGLKAVDSGGHRVGEVRQVFVCDRTGEPEWLEIHHGVRGGELYVPIGQAELRRGAIVLPYDRHRLRDAPRYPSTARLTPRQERELRRYWGGADGAAGADRAADGGGATAEGEDRGPVRGQRAGESPYRKFGGYSQGYMGGGRGRFDHYEEETASDTASRPDLSE